MGEHTIAALMNCRSDKILRLTVLLHDVAKPRCKRVDEKGIFHFHGHARVGAEVAEDILRRLKFDNDTIARVTALIVWHDDLPELQERAVRRAIHRVGPAQYPRLFEVMRADTLAKSDYRREEKLSKISVYEQLYEGIMAKRQCLSIADLAVSGRDLIALGMKPGKEIGEMLQHLLLHVLECPEDNTPEILQNLIKTEQKSE